MTMQHRPMDRAMTHGYSPASHCGDTGFSSSPYRICGWYNANETHFSGSTLVFHWQYRCNWNACYFINLSPMLHRLCNWQGR